MKVFLSWSGQVSKSVAEVLREWLPNVIQAIVPWMSAEDIEKGALWSNELAENLASIKAGISCVTPESQDSAWLNFEAGALARTVEKTMVCTYLIGMRPTEVKGPLARFQHSVADKPDTLRLLRTLNSALGGESLTEAKLVAAFERWWPDLDDKLASISSAHPVKETVRPPQEMLEEILTIVRELALQSKPPGAPSNEWNAWLTDPAGKSWALRRLDLEKPKVSTFKSVRDIVGGAETLKGEEEPET